MKRRPHILARCMEPVAMTEDMLRVCIAVASGDEHFAEERKAALDAREGAPLENDRGEFAIVDGVATVPVCGPLTRKASIFSDVSAMSSYSQIGADFDQAIAAVKSGRAQSIGFAFDSPGGEVSGLFELADKIHAARMAGVSMSANVAKADSAAYVLAAAVGNICIEQAGECGSIGVIAAVMPKDSDGAIEFTSSVSPFKNLDPAGDEGRKRFQARVDSLGSLLVEKVAAYRGVTPEKVAADFGQGDVMHGAAAVKAGLADRVGAMNHMRGAMPLRTNRTTQGAAKMDPTIFGLSADADEATVRATATALVDLATFAIESLGAANASEARGKLSAAVEARATVEALSADNARLRTEGIKRDLRATLETGIAKGTLSLGAIQKSIPPVLRGKPKADWTAAMGALDSVSAESVVNAACGIAITADDLEAIAGYVASMTAPIVAATGDEPPRSTDAEAAAISETNAMIDALIANHKTSRGPAAINGAAK